MAVKYLLALSFFLASTWQPFFKLSNSVDAVPLLEEDSGLKVQKKQKDFQPKGRNGDLDGKNISHASNMAPLSDRVMSAQFGGEPIKIIIKKEGESCGSCMCPPTFTAGECERDLECVYNKNIADAPGTCMVTDQHDRCGRGYWNQKDDARCKSGCSGAKSVCRCTLRGCPESRPDCNQCSCMCAFKGDETGTHIPREIRSCRFPCIRRCPSGNRAICCEASKSCKCPEEENCSTEAHYPHPPIRTNVPDSPPGLPRNHKGPMFVLNRGNMRNYFENSQDSTYPPNYSKK